MMNTTRNSGRIFSETQVMTSSTLKRKKTNTGRSFRRCLIMNCLAAVTFAGIAHADESVAPSPEARPMTGVELYLLYRDKSWAWSDGAARFDDQSRRFTARIGAGNTAVSAKGRWIVTDDGRLCLAAQWHIASRVYANTTCFDHRQERETIYQRKEPSGSWYIFKHAVPTKNDEFAKLTDTRWSSDMVTSEATDRGP
jgi:hypothetical protein